VCDSLFIAYLSFLRKGVSIIKAVVSLFWTVFHFHVLNHLADCLEI